MRELVGVVRPALMLLFLAVILPLTARGDELSDLVFAPPKLSAGPTKAIAIPEGTTVLMHFFGVVEPQHDDGNGYYNEIVIQVDKDVVVNDTVIIPRGSIGFAGTDSARCFTAHLDGDSLTICRGKLHAVFVYSVRSTQMLFDDNSVNYEVKNGYFHPDQYTVKLKAATLVVPL
jgi:hypothetical protein